MRGKEINPFVFAIKYVSKFDMNRFHISLYDTCFLLFQFTVLLSAVSFQFRFIIFKICTLYHKMMERNCMFECMYNHN